MLNVIQFEQRFDGVMRQLFAETAIVPTLAVGQNVSRNERFNCVTLEGNLQKVWRTLFFAFLGDQVNRRGPLTGGYMDRKRSKLEASISLRELRSRISAVEV